MAITPEHYLRDGATSGWNVPDLLPTCASDIRLLFVFESPHVDELEVPRRPIVGGAGKSALKFLQGASWTGDSLGGLVADRQSAGDGRLAVMNVSTLPLQKAAFVRTTAKPDLTPQDWRWLGQTFRKSTAKTLTATPSAKANAAARLLLDSLQHRIDRNRLDQACTVVACGRWVQRYVHELSRLSSAPLNVPHPANNQWHPKRTSVPPDLIFVRELFVEHTA